MSIRIKATLPLTLCLALLVACESAPPQPAATPSETSQAPAPAEESPEPTTDAFVFEVEALPLREEHHVLVVRVTQDFETPLHREPRSDAPTNGLLSLSTEAVLGLAGYSDGEANLAFERSLLRIPGESLEAPTSFELEGTSVAQGQRYYLLPIYAGEGMFSFHFAINGQEIQTYDPPEASFGGRSYDEIADLNRVLMTHEDAEWWGHITLSADEMGWFRLDRPETEADLVESPDW